MEIKVVFAALVALVALPGSQASLGVLSNALQAFSCGCGCRFYDVGTCETRVKKECETTYQNKDYDVLLDAPSDYETNIQYIDRIMEDPVDFIETFPANYDGSPNITMDQA